jgi:VWFA-related protein
VTTQAVAVGVVVRDTKGNTVTNLKEKDFEVLDNGKPQKISAFSVETIAPPTSPAASATPSSEIQRSPVAPSAAAAVAGAATPVQPRFIAMYFDDVHTEFGDLERAKIAAKGLAQNGIEVGDKLAVFTGSSITTADFTTDSPKVLAAIDQISPHPRMSPDGIPGCPKITPYEAYLVNNHLDLVIQGRLEDDAQRCMCEIEVGQPGCVDAAKRTVEARAQQTWDQTEQISQVTLETLRGVITYLGKMPGQRILVVASSGYLNGGLELGYKQDLIVNDALHAGIVINSIDLKGLATGGPGGAVGGLKDINKDTVAMSPYELMYDSIIFGQKLSSFNASMWELADATGGTFFHNNNDLGKGFHRLTDAPDIEYQLTYTPETLKEDGKFHKIQVKLVEPHSYLVQARTGYFAPTKEMKKSTPPTAIPPTPAAPAPAPLSAIDREVLAADSISDIAATVDVKPGKNDQGQSALLATVHIDVKMLSFQHKDDRNIEKLTFVLALFDEKGNFTSGQQGEMNLALKESTLGKFDEKGLNAKLWLQAPPGNYRLRAVAQESVAGKIFASSQPVEIP